MRSDGGGTNRLFSAKAAANIFSIRLLTFAEYTIFPWYWFCDNRCRSHDKGLSIATAVSEV
jgi:hypothetical protein